MSAFQPAILQFNRHILTVISLQESISARKTPSSEMVGTSPKQLESSVCESLNPETDDTLERDISQFLLLHHDYAAKPQEEKPPRKTTKVNTKSKLKKIRPKVTKETTLVPNNEEVIYGTYDENTNCITIIVNDDNLRLDEVVTEVASVPDSDVSGQHLTVPSVTNPSSPGSNIRSDSSDCGYESLDSPHSVMTEEIDIWDESVSELFPSLI